MRYGIVEGEPGIFPDPIARFLRWLGRLARREKPEQPHQTGDHPEAGEDPAAK